jgi:hypothetical protein
MGLENILIAKLRRGEETHEGVESGEEKGEAETNTTTRRRRKG